MNRRAADERKAENANRLTDGRSLLTWPVRAYGGAVSNTKIASWPYLSRSSDNHSSPLLIRWN